MGGCLRTSQVHPSNDQRPVVAPKAEESVNELASAVTQPTAAAASTVDRTPTAKTPSPDLDAQHLQPSTAARLTKASLQAEGSVDHSHNPLREQARAQDQQGPGLDDIAARPACMHQEQAGSSAIRGAASAPPARRARRQPASEEGQLRLHDIRFCQGTISPTFRNGRSILNTIEMLKSGELQVKDLQKIRVVELECGFWFSLDNRRLHCLKTAFPASAFGDKMLDVLVLQLSDPDVLEEFRWKFSCGKKVWVSRRSASAPAASAPAAGQGRTTDRSPGPTLGQHQGQGRGRGRGQSRAEGQERGRGSRAESQERGRGRGQSRGNSQSQNRSSRRNRGKAKAKAVAGLGVVEVAQAEAVAAVVGAASAAAAEAGSSDEDWSIEECSSGAEYSGRFEDESMDEDSSRLDDSERDYDDVVQHRTEGICP